MRYTKCSNCGHAVAIPHVRPKVPSRRIEGVPGLWRPTAYGGVHRGDEVLIMLNTITGKRAARYHRGFVVRKYQGLAMRVVGTRRGGQMFVDKATVSNAAAIFVRVRDEG